MKLLLALMLVVANRGGGTATLIEPATMTVVATVDAGPQPHEVAASADGRFAYVTNYVNSNGNTLTVIDLDARQKVKTINLGTLRGPHGIVQWGGRIYFTAEAASSVASYNPATDTIDWIARTNQSGTHMLRVAPDGRAIYTANIGSATASIIDRDATAARKNIPTVGAGEGIDVSPDGRELWVGSVQTGGIAIIDLTTETRVATINTTEPSYRITFTADGTRVLVPRGRAFAVYDRLARTEVQRIATTGVVLSILAARDAVYVAMTDPNQVVKLDPVTFQQLGSAPAGPLPDGMALAIKPGPKRRSARH
ncbi:MAG TPA: YncE family protein [Thermoanaerobaculia bacterium]|jgi:DNA-binding beta-propeller fold protein YncE